MAKNIGDNVPTQLDGLGYAFDKVLFQKGNPPLDSELNLSQELNSVLTQKSTADLPSGWLSFRPKYTSRELSNSFLTQNPNGSKPEVALVNGWPIYVTNTGTPLKHVNKINFEDYELNSGSRVDGVFLEVWRSVISSSDENVASKPQDLSKVSDIKAIYMFNEDLGWAVGNNGVILNTLDSGVSWSSQDTPVKINFNSVKFIDRSTGYIVGDGGYILKTIDGGGNWYILNNNATDNLNSVFIIDSQRVVVVGDNGTILRSIDGETFAIADKSASIVDHLNSVFFIDRSLGWLVGDKGSYAVTRDGGFSWTKQKVLDPYTEAVITENLNSIAFYNYNDGLIAGDNGLIMKSADSGYNWANVSDRIMIDGSFKSLTEAYPTKEINLNKISLVRKFPVQFSIKIYETSTDFFKDAAYAISPPEHPNALVLTYIGTQDGLTYKSVLDLNLYANSDDLRVAINGIRSPYLSSDVGLSNRTEARVFDAIVDYTAADRTNDIKPTSGTISGAGDALINFSVDDKAWIVGDKGTVLVSNNSGAKWEESNIGFGYDFKGSSFVDSNNGWLVGSTGSIVKYEDTTGTAVAEVQETDLVSQSSGRIYPEGNVLSEAENFLDDNIIDPQVGVETSRRVQIQYRIRVVDGVNPFSNPEAGLGQDFVYSQGPNESGVAGGEYPYFNMGSENGDYGLWRARCRNTVDGYSWAIPMFLVNRKNSSPFDKDSNINGSTNYELNAVRPDGALYEEITEDEVLDLRKLVNVKSYSRLIENNFDKLLSNQLSTNISDRDERGAQSGSVLINTDTYTGTASIQSVLRGQISSQAVLNTVDKILDASIIPTVDDLTFATLDSGLYHNDTAFYSAEVVVPRIVQFGPLVGDPYSVVGKVDGTFVGVGTKTVSFSISEDALKGNFGARFKGRRVRIRATYIDYGRIGLKKVPSKPLSVRYNADINTIDNVYYFKGINSRLNSIKSDAIEERVSGYKDYAETYSALTILERDDNDDVKLYGYAGTEERTTTDYRKSIRKFEGQQNRGTLVKYHYFYTQYVSTNVIKVPKNINGYFVFGVSQVKNVNGSEYKISSDYTNSQVMLDRELNDDGTYNTDNLIIYLDEAFKIPANSIIEVVLDVTIDPTVFGVEDGVNFTEDDAADINVTVLNKGENRDAQRTPFVSNYNSSSRGLGGLYTSILYPVEVNDGDAVTSVSIDLNENSRVRGLLNGTILGVNTFNTASNSNQWYIWNKPNLEDVYKVLPVKSIEGLGTSSVTLNLDPESFALSGNVLIPVLVKLDTLPEISESSELDVFYNYNTYQSVRDLPSELDLDIVKSSDYVYVSNLGTGANPLIKGLPYEIPVEHIAVNDPDIKSDNIFSNIDDLDFNNFSIDTGFVKMPAIISRKYGGDLTLSNPNNVGDMMGRAYYSEASEEIVYQCESLTISSPRKVFTPMLARVRTDMVKPFVRGEIVLLILSKVYKARPDNITGYYEELETYTTEELNEVPETAISVYKLNNRPIVRV
jgi:photosystem II stability/assembly factor-like uncharacterized protein